MSNTLNYALRPLEPIRYDRSAWWWARVWYFLGGVAVPVACWIGSFQPSEPPHPEWQSGKWDEMTGVLLAGQAAWPMFFLMGYAILSLVLLLIRREYFSQWFAVRLGIYTGTIVAGLFVIVHLIAAKMLSVIFGGGVLLMVAVPAVALWWLVRRVGAKWVVLTLAGLAALAFVVAAIGALLDANLEIIFTPFIVLYLVALGSGPAVALATFSLMTFWLFRHSNTATPVVALAGVGSWCAAFAGSVWLTAHTAMRHYASLPKDPPGGCYIATAAARGHRRFVGSDGGSINTQLRVLKAGEILIQTFAPRTHRLMRQVYDWLGPRLAARIRSPYTADAAYMALKILELPTAALLKASGLWRAAMRLYRDKPCSN